MKRALGMPSFTYFEPLRTRRQRLTLSMAVLVLHNCSAQMFWPLRDSRVRLAAFERAHA